MKIAKINLYEEYRQTLDDNDQKKLSAFFMDLDCHNSLAHKEHLLIRRDFENAIVYYAQHQVPLDDALNRLAPLNLGGFYARPPILWYPLDDAAKIYPLSIKHGQMPVFRLSFYLKEKVIPEILQIALTFTIKRFPSFATTVKKGFFWHYLDTAKRRYIAEEEKDVPCRPLMIAQSGSQSFRVIYYQNRISIEFFHILTDGTGGLLLLKTLASEYLRLLGVHVKDNEEIFDINQIPHIQETSNEFKKADMKKKASGFLGRPALQMSGKISKIKPCRIIHYKIDAHQLKEIAHSKQATVTAYILSLVLVASKYATDEVRGSVNIQVPVNMRKFYPSLTVRNFSMYCGVRLRIDKIDNVNQVLPEVIDQLQVKTAQEPMSKMMAATAKMVKSLRLVPLFIKAPVAGIIFGFLSDKIFTNTLSNLGIVKLPKAMADHIENVDFILGPAITNRASCTLVTYKNTTTLSVSKITIDPSFEEKLYALLCEDGLTPILEGSDVYESK